MVFLTACTIGNVTIDRETQIRDELTARNLPVVETWFSENMPTHPLQITVSDTPNSFAEENWAIVLVKSSGADSPRQIKLRRKPSTGQWFLNELMCLSDIKMPTELDPWA